MRERGNMKERERKGSERERERDGESMRRGKERKRAKRDRNSNFFWVISISSLSILKSLKTDVPKLYAYNECEHSVTYTDRLRCPVIRKVKGIKFDNLTWQIVDRCRPLVHDRMADWQMGQPCCSCSLDILNNNSYIDLGRTGCKFYRKHNPL